MSNYIIVDGQLYHTDSLCHYGILGMKWGVRRYQYEDMSLTPAGRLRYGYGDGRRRFAAEKTASSRFRSLANRPAKKPGTKNRSVNATKKQSEENISAEKKGLTDKQKKAIKIGAATVAAGLAIYGGYKLSKMYKGAGQKIDPKTGFRLLNKPMTDAQTLSKVNPGRISFLSRHKNVEIIKGSSMNCMLCTTSYDLRKRGFDVHAGYSTRGYMPDDLFSKIYSNYKGTDKIDVVERIFDNKGFLSDSKSLSTTDILSNIEKNLMQHGSGSRGNIVVWWKQGGGHSMIWENIDGKIQFKDGQTNQVYKNFAQEILKHASDARPIELLRTDNLDINLSEMKKVINSDTVVKTYVDHGAEIAWNLANDPRVQLTAAGTVYGGSYAYAYANKRRGVK